MTPGVSEARSGGGPTMSTVQRKKVPRLTVVQVVGTAKMHQRVPLTGTSHLAWFTETWPLYSVNAAANENAATAALGPRPS